MTKEKKIIIGIISILTIVIVILSYFLINKNAIIKKQAEGMELQAMETNGSNSYTTTEEHLQEISQNIANNESKILWENPNPTSAVSSFTVKCEEINNFDKVLICFKAYANTYNTLAYLYNETSNFTTMTVYIPFNLTNQSVLGWRSVTLNDNIFSFSNGFFGNVGHGSNEASAIPLWIMGINLNQ